MFRRVETKIKKLVKEKKCENGLLGISDFL